MKTIVVFCFSLLIYISGFSQETSISFSLKDAINYALENNRMAKNAAKDIDAAKQQKWETTATGLPQISTSIDYQNFLKQPVSLIPAEFFGGNPGAFSEVIFGTKHNVTATATLTQKLFDGSFLVALQSAKVFLEISKNAKEKTDLEIRKAVVTAYSNVLLAEDRITVLQSNIKNLEKTLFEITKIYENGLVEEERVEQLQITLSSLKNNLNNVIRLKKLAYQMLNITIGLDINTPTVLTEILEDLTNKHIQLGLLETNESIEETIDYRIAQNDKITKELLLKLEKSKALPTLNTFINGGFSAFGNDFNFASRDQKWFGSSLLGISLNIPIFSSLGRRAATQRAKINLEKAENHLTETQQKIALQIASAKSDYQFAMQDFENKKQNLNLAQRIEAKNQTKFLEGIASSFELRQAQTQLYNAQQELSQTMIDVINKKVALETILNDLD